MTSRCEEEVARRKRTRGPSRPGEVLVELYLAPHGFTVAKCAAACGVSRKHLDAIVNGRAPRLTAQMAIRLATALDTSPDFWLDLQRARELYDARKHIAASGTRPRQITEVKEVPHR